MLFTGWTIYFKTMTTMAIQKSDKQCIVLWGCLENFLLERLQTYPRASLKPPKGFSKGKPKAASVATPSLMANLSRLYKFLK